MSMDTKQSNEELLDDLQTNKAYIAFLVHGENCYWVVDWDEHFNLDHARNIEAFCKNKETLKYITKKWDVEEYKRDAYARYRGGIPLLTYDTLPAYLALSSTRVVQISELAEALRLSRWGNFDRLYAEMESITHFGQNELSGDQYEHLYKLRKFLPSFYINFNKKIFMHMREHRMYEGVVHENWYGAAGDFEHMIPVDYRYWETEAKVDYWAINNFISL